MVSTNIPTDIKQGGNQSGWIPRIYRRVHLAHRYADAIIRHQNDKANLGQLAALMQEKVRIGFRKVGVDLLTEGDYLRRQSIPFNNFAHEGKKLDTPLGLLEDLQTSWDDFSARQLSLREKADQQSFKDRFWCLFFGAEQEMRAIEQVDFALVSRAIGPILGHFTIQLNAALDIPEAERLSEGSKAQEKVAFWQKLQFFLVPQGMQIWVKNPSYLFGGEHAIELMEALNAADNKGAVLGQIQRRIALIVKYCD